MHSLTLLCRRTHAIAARVLYRKVAVSQGTTRHFFSAIIMPSISERLPYSSYIQTLTMSVTHECDIYLTYPVFCLALTQMVNLSSLTLVVPQIHAPFLIQHMRSTNIICSCSPFMESIYRRLKPSTSTYHAAPTLPQLSSLTIKGDIRLIQIAKFRGLSSVHIAQLLGTSALLQVLEALTNDGPNTTLQHLAVIFAFHTTAEIQMALKAIDGALANLEILVFFVPNANTLVCISVILCHSFLTLYIGYIQAPRNNGNFPSTSRLRCEYDDSGIAPNQHAEIGGVLTPAAATSPRVKVPP